MAFGISSLSSVCRQFSDVLKAGLQLGGSQIKVMIGTPAAASPAAGDPAHHLNLFFFRFEPSGFYPDAMPGDPWLVRMHCLITPFCAEENPITAGDNDLRVIGEVMRFLHEKPTHTFTVQNQKFFVQSVFCTLGLDQLNQLWSTQGDTIYRPSVLCEVSLAPVMPLQPTTPAMLVGAIGADVRATMAGRDDAPTGTANGAPLLQERRIEPNVLVESWAPALCLVEHQRCLRSIVLKAGADAAAFQPEAWVAGAIGEDVTLRWQVWTPTGWVEHVPATNFTILDAAIAPGEVASANTVPVDLPFSDRAGQMLLRAHRSVIRAADGQRIEVRSEPVLVTLFEVP